MNNKTDNLTPQNDNYCLNSDVADIIFFVKAILGFQKKKKLKIFELDQFKLN